MSAAASTAPRSSKQSKLRRATAVTVAVLSVGALVGCGSDRTRSDRSGNDRDSVTAYQSRSSGPATGEIGDYPMVAKKSFIDGCVESGATSRSTCRCIIDKFEEQLPLDTFLEQSVQAYRTHEVPDGWVETISKCLPGGGSGDSGDFPTTI